MEFIHICTPNAQLCHKFIVGHTGVVGSNIGGIAVGSATLTDMEVQVEFCAVSRVVIDLSLSCALLKIERTIGIQYHSQTTHRLSRIIH